MPVAQRSWQRQWLPLVMMMVAHWWPAHGSRPIFPDPRNFQAQSNGDQPMLASFDHTYPPLPILPDELTIARAPEKAFLRAQGSSRLTEGGGSASSASYDDGEGGPLHPQAVFLASAGPAVGMGGGDYDAHTNQFGQHLPVVQPEFGGGPGFSPPFTFAHANAFLNRRGGGSAGGGGGWGGGGGGGGGGRRGGGEEEEEGAQMAAALPLVARSSV
jgi:hypothetical protein